ncbi:unnamed protein product [Linum tenue]|uniref:HMG box domain-containing protein n=1 Tax=Linum tenue TaxID=586396 RepID=A0AAV0KT98_9ROSI|nr:unnamed protein product [Linum tenue]
MNSCITCLIIFRKASKRKAAPVSVADKGDKQRARKDKKAKKDPNKPKRPPTAFFVFLYALDTIYLTVGRICLCGSKVGKAGGQKWREMSAAEKAPYEAKAGKKKDEYGKLMDAYNNKKDSDRSKSEVNDDDDEEDAPATKEAPHEEEQEVEEQEEEEEDEEEEDADEDDED